MTDVVFFGLKKVMPLMTEGLLQFPTLSSQYFSLVSDDKWRATWLRFVKYRCNESRPCPFCFAVLDVM